jgi:hypothetical protein
MSKQTFRHAVWVRILLGVLIIASTYILLAGFYSGGLPVRLTLCSFMVLAAGALIEVLFSKIEVRPDGLLIVSLSGRRFIARRDIESVTWEKGCGVSVRLRGGKWVRLPDLGHDARDVANSIREWLHVGG